MKTITFFSEKGGVGKSSFSMMYASWLHYKHGVSVALADFNLKISAYRRAEIRYREDLMTRKGDVEPFDLKGAWPIVDCLPGKIDELRNRKTLYPYATWFERECGQGGLKGHDVVLCDFPGSLSGDEFIELCGLGLLGLVIIPTDRDHMTLSAMVSLHQMIPNTNHRVFINKAQTGLRNIRSKYIALAAKLIESGIPLLPDMISNSDRMTNIEKVDNIRSTFGYPDFSLPEYGKARDLGTENLFIDITRELAKTRDLKGTPMADLSFVNGMAKRDDGRQLRGTPYPHLEIIQ